MQNGNNGFREPVKPMESKQNEPFKQTPKNKTTSPTLFTESEFFPSSQLPHYVLFLGI
jgi:hypothetical protein